MNTVDLPPSPNWYLSCNFSCSVDRTIAWGARNGIVIGTPNDDNIYEFSIIRNCHKERVTSVVFHPEFDTKNCFLASTGEDDAFKIWNVESKELAYFHFLGTGKQTVGVAWSNLELVHLYCLTQDGSIISWNAHLNIVTTMSLEKVTPTCISCCPHDPHLLAIGSKTGLVYIVYFCGKGSVLYKLRGHDKEVVDLSWCPSPKNVLQRSDRKDLLLASGGKDRSIFIWKAGNDGRLEMEIALPTTPLVSHRHRGKLNTSVGNWIAVCWVHPKLLLTSSVWGELLSWNLSTLKNNKPICKLIHAYHSRGLFCIWNVPELQPDPVEDWRQKESFKIWTLAQDRQIICSNIRQDEITIEHNIYSQGGRVYAIAACPLDTSRIAFGVGDAMIRLWNLSESHDTSFDISMLWQRIKGTIRSMAWHPQRENLLAFATGEGRVAVFDTNRDRPPILYKQHHTSTVYTLGWGPKPKTNRFVLYSCEKGELVFFDPEKPEEDPTIVIDKGCTEFAWKPDFSCLAVGFEDGSVSLYNRDLVPYEETANFSTKTTHCIAWHPDSTLTDIGLSPFRNYIAVAFDADVILVIDVSNLINNSQEMESTTDSDNLEHSFKAYKIVTTLVGHTEKVVCLAWSPHFGGQLVSGSFDCTAHVWNIETHQLIGKYITHSGPVLCCIWSPLRPDLIISGSADFTVRIWKIEGADMKTPSVQKQEKKSGKKNRKKKTAKVEATNMSPDVDHKISTDNTSPIPQMKPISAKDSKKQKSERTPYFVNTIGTVTDKTLIIKAILPLIENLTKSKETAAEVDIKVIKETEGSTTKRTIASLFSENKEVASILEIERNEHTKQGRHNITSEMTLWTDDLRRNLEEAATEKRLNDFLISLAPSVSIRTWKEMCEIYAYQLALEGNPCKAASYLLAIHKTYQALQIFEDAHFYKEAYTIARFKLAPEDPVIEKLIKSWAAYSVDTGQFENAAYLYAKLGDFPKVMQYLRRRKDAFTLMTASEIASLTGDQQLSKVLAHKAINATLNTLDYKYARSIISKFQYLQYRLLHVNTLSELKVMIQGKISAGSILLWVNGQSNYGMMETLRISCPNCSNYYEQLRECNFSEPLEASENGKFLLMVTYELALAAACANPEEAIKHIITTFRIVMKYELDNPSVCESLPTNYLIDLLIKVDRNGPNNEKSIYAKNIYSVSMSSRAYLCYGLLRWITAANDIRITEKADFIFVELIEDLLPDAINERSIKAWQIINDIKKMETKLASLLCKKQEGDENAEDNTEPLLLELDKLRAEKKELNEQLVTIPNPVVTFGLANELAGILYIQKAKTKFVRILNEVWTNATMK